MTKITPAVGPATQKQSRAVVETHIDNRKVVSRSKEYAHAGRVGFDIDAVLTIEDNDCRRIGYPGTGADLRMAQDQRWKKRPARRQRTPGAQPARTRPPGKEHATGSRNDKAIITEVGIRLKYLRTQAGLTLEALSEKSGVSRAMLSKVERGEKSPTLTVFVRIATGLGVSLSTLMGAEADLAETAIIRADKRLTYEDPETGFERHILSPNHIENGIELLLHRIPPGKSSGVLPPYNVPTEKLLVVHQGRLTVHCGEKHYDLNSGDSFYFEVREPYSFVNAGKTWCSYYLIIAQRR